MKTCKITPNDSSVKFLNLTELSHRPISFATADELVLLLEKLSAFYPGKCQPRLYKKIRRRLSAVLYDSCCIKPYLNPNVNHLDFWRRYFPKIVLLKDAGIFDEKGLPWLLQISFKKFYDGDIDVYEKHLGRWQKLRRFCRLYGKN